MMVVGAPMSGDVLQAQKRLKPQKEIHGKGFGEILQSKIKELNNGRVDERNSKNSRGCEDFIV